MKNPRSPCADCPYRKDAPLAKWHREEFEKVRRSRAAEQSGGVYERLHSGTFACHKHAALPDKERGWCAGWAIMQQREGVPSLPLRFQLMRSPEDAADFEALTSSGLELFSSTEEMLEANCEADTLDDV